MSASTTPASQRRKPTTRMLLLGFLGVVVAVISGRIFLGSPAERVARPHLKKAEQAAESAIESQIKEVNNFFAVAKKGTYNFAEDALGWGSKWRLVVDQLPFTEGNRHRKFLRAKFEEHVFSADQLENFVRQVVQDYLAHVRSIENRMLVDLRADLSDSPADYPLARWDDRRLQECFDQALFQTVTASGVNFGADLATQMVSFIAGEILTHVAIRLGVSAGILGTGAASGWVTFGVGAVIGLIIDQIVSWVWDQLADPKGNLAAELNKKLDEMHRLIVEGSTEVQGLRDRLKEFARQRAAMRRTAVLNLLETGGGAR